MAFRCFVIPIRDREKAESEINTFLDGKAVRSVRKEFVQQGDDSFWSLLVEYDSIESGNEKQRTVKKQKIDYQEKLSPGDFAVFDKLRAWRKVEAEKDKAPVYTIFNNEQLAKIVESGAAKLEDLRAIEGLGDARVEKYGNAVLKIIANPTPVDKKS